MSEIQSDLISQRSESVAEEIQNLAGKEIAEI